MRVPTTQPLHCKGPRCGWGVSPQVTLPEGAGSPSKALMAKWRRSTLVALDLGLTSTGSQTGKEADAL